MKAVHHDSQNKTTEHNGTQQNKKSLSTATLYAENSHAECHF